MYHVFSDGDHIVTRPTLESAKNYILESLPYCSSVHVWEIYRKTECLYTLEG